MSKITKRVERVINEGFSTKEDVLCTAKMINAGKQTVTQEEALKHLGEAADTLDVAFKRMRHNMDVLHSSEVNLAKEAKALTSRCKDLAGQVGDAMTRIDKVVTKDFDQKLAQLERFVCAMSALHEMKRSGDLDAVIGAFNRNRNNET
jgi:cell division protein ZapA (FtsZ GTPase activity inhibitor)